MGNCMFNPKKSTAEIVPHDQHPQNKQFQPQHQNPDVRLYGPLSTSHTLYIRLALLHKGLSVRFTASESDSEPIAIHVGSERVSGTRESLLQYIEARFPGPPLVVGPRGVETGDDTTPLGVKLTVLQHRSVIRHVDSLVRWAEDVATRGVMRSGGGVDPTVGTPRMELKKFGKSYSQLLELMLEHAQMEERVLFPILNSSDPEICKAANQEHARDLPIMNGIKEDIKSIGVLNNGSPAYEEALSNLSKRLKSLQQHCKEHFMEEEKELLPYMEAVELSKEQQQRVLEQSLDAMRGTHSHLLSFFLEGLLPLEAMQYLDLISMCYSEEQISSRIRVIFPE